MSRRTDPLDKIDHLIYTGRITPDQGKYLREVREDLRRRRRRRMADGLFVLWMVFCLGGGLVAWCMYVAWSYGH